MPESTFTRRRFLTLAGMVAAAMLLPPTNLFAAEKRKPNVIVIVADDQGYAEMSCEGVTTPYLDSIAKNGIRFTDAYVSCPVCSPSRARLLTGRYQERFGHYHNPPSTLDEGNWGLPLDQKTIAQYMKEQGYATGAIGKWHLGDNAARHPNKRGFDEYFGFLSDNGGPTPDTTSSNFPFRGYKMQVHEGGIRIPFMMEWKGHIPAGKLYIRPIISLDILPTAVSVAEGKIDPDIDGVNLLPYIDSKNSQSSHDVLCWRFDKQSATRMGYWKLSKHTGYGIKLYNPASDPGEKDDLSAKYPKKAKELQAAWDKWNAKNIDPLWPSKVDTPWTDKDW